MTIGLDHHTTDDQSVAWEFKTNDRIRLKADVSDIYSLAPAGAEGWVRGRKIDPIGDFKMVFVEWDPAHWTYNHQPDMWTFESHFDKVEEDKPMADTPDKDKDAVRQALSILAGALGVGETDTPTQEEIGEQRAEAVTPDRMKQYEQVFKKAVEVASDSDAFLIACIKKEDAEDGKFNLIPALFSYSMSTASAVLLDAQLSEVVADAHQSLAVRELHRLLDGDVKDS